MDVQGREPRHHRLHVARQVGGWHPSQRVQDQAQQVEVGHLDLHVSDDVREVQGVDLLRDLRHNVVEVGLVKLRADVS